MTRHHVVFFRAVALVLLILTALIASWRVFSEAREVPTSIPSAASDE